MPWTIRCPFQPDESISSWLARAALMQGCDPLVLTGSVWPGSRVWTVDVDRGLDRSHLEKLSQPSGISVVRLEQAALRPEAEKLAKRPLTSTGTWAWVLTLGSRNRRRHSGLQFCPDCLASDTSPYFRRRWRFAWHVGCAQHGLGLLDQCSTCGAPITPHQLVAEDRLLVFCSRCHADLRKARTTPASGTAPAFQRAADQVMKDSVGLFGSSTVSVVDWFATARFYAGLLRSMAHHPGSKLATEVHSLGINVRYSDLPAIGLPLELLPTADRVPLLDAVHQLMTLGPEPLQMALKDGRITADSICSPGGSLPAPLKEMISSFPSKGRSTRRPRRQNTPQPRTEAAVRSAWARLRRKAGAGVSP